MNNKQVLQVFKELSHSQGSYSRLLSTLNELDDDTKNQFLNQFKDCNYPVDVILKIEG